MFLKLHLIMGFRNSIVLLSLKDFLFAEYLLSAFRVWAQFDLWDTYILALAESAL